MKYSISDLTDVLTAPLAELTLPRPPPSCLPSQSLAGRRTAGLRRGRGSLLALSGHQHLLVLVVEPGRDVGHVHEDPHRDVEVAGGGRGLPVRPYVGQRVVSGYGASLRPLSPT